MPTSKSNNPRPGPDQRPPAIAIDAELAGRLVAALEQLGVAFAPDRRKDAHRRHRGTVDPIRARASRDYEVLRGMLGRADAPTPLQMRRERTYGQGEPDVEEKGSSEQDVSDNAVVVEDLVPLSASYATIESPGDGTTSPLSQRVDIPYGDRRPRLALTKISSRMPISRVEISDEKDQLVAFGPSFDPLNQPYDQPSGGR